MNYSLLRYPGGKTRAVNLLRRFIPYGTTEICSPFFGGGSFEIYLSSVGIKIHGYDILSPLVTFWKCVLNDSEKLYNTVLNKYPITSDIFNKFKKELDVTTDEYETASLFYILNRSSYSGLGILSTMSKNHSRFTLKSIENIKNFNYKFQIENLSFEKSILNHDCLVYADPPYFLDQKIYSKKSNNEFNHNLLAEVLNERKNFILSYNNTEEIKQLYKHHTFIYPEWSYGMNSNKKSNEILIISNDIFKK